MKPSIAVALIALSCSVTSHAAVPSSAPFHRGAPLDDWPGGGWLFAPFASTVVPTGGLIASFGSVVDGPPVVGTASAPVAAQPLYPPYPPVAGDGAEARSFTSGTLAGSLYSLIVSGVGNASTGSYLDGTPIAAAAPPQAYAMLLAGLLAIGFILRRRSD